MHNNNLIITWEKCVQIKNTTAGGQLVIESISEFDALYANLTALLTLSDDFAADAQLNPIVGDFFQQPIYVQLYACILILFFTFFHGTLATLLYTNAFRAALQNK